jgi:hypothetical protein
VICLKRRCCFSFGLPGLLSVALFLTTAPHAVAGVICVDDDNTTPVQQGTTKYPYASLQAAIDSAANGDTIQVASGTYGQIDNENKALTLRGGYSGATATDYISGLGGDFSQQSTVQGGDTVISGGTDKIGVNLTRNTEDPAFSLILDRFKIRENLKGIVCDTTESWPHAKDVTISNCIIEENGQAGEPSAGAGVLICGENLTIINNAIRNNQGARGAGVYGAASNLLIKGNTIEGNTCYGDHGGGLFLGGTATLENNLIAGNRVNLHYGWGGGVLIVGTAHMSGNIIRDNYAPTYGGGIFVDESATAYLDHELIYRNRIADGADGGQGGAGLAVDAGYPGPSHLTLTNSTVAENGISESVRGGNGLFIDVGSTAIVKDSIFWGNHDDFYVREGSSLTITYSLTQEGWSGAGNLSKDPLFANPTDGDFHLRSRGGRYDPESAAWVNDIEHSPAIDVGDPAAAFVNESPPNGARINLGSFGNTAQASRSFAAPPTRLLSVTRVGVPGDTVTSTPPGIACGTACSAAFIAGTQIVLTANPAAGTIFAGWGDACHGSQAICNLVLEQDRTATASFILPTAGSWRQALP